MTDTAKIEAWLAAVPEWQPIESAPRDGTEVLLCGHNYNDPNQGFWQATGIFEDGNWRYRAGGIETLDYAKYWMPLPASPKPHGGDV